MKIIYNAPQMGYASLNAEGVICTSFIGFEGKNASSAVFEEFEDGEFNWD